MTLGLVNGLIEDALTPVKSELTAFGINKSEYIDNFTKGVSCVGRERKPIVTFIDDDNSTAILDNWIPLVQQKDFPLSMAIIVGNVGNAGANSWSALHELHETYGIEILSHSYYHRTLETDYDDLTVDEIAENDFGKAKKILAEHGFKTDILCYPGASSNIVKVRQAALRDYAFAVQAGGSKVNTMPIDQMFIFRYPLGTNDGQTVDLDTFKAYVDECVSKKGWLMFMSHSHYTGMTPETMAVIGELIDYIRSSGAEIVSVKDGLSLFANSVNVENENVESGGGFVVDPFGSVKAKGIGCGFSTKQIHDYYSHVNSYEDNNLTEERIITNATNFPHSAYGVLRSLRTDTNLVQTFIPYGYQEMWMRKVNGDTLPADFTCQCTPSGTYDNRNLFAFERKGNAYYDETNDRVIFCKTAGKRSVDQLTVTHGATASGNIKISFAFGTKDIAVEAGDTAEDVAEKIASNSFVGHSIMQSAENKNVLYLTRILAQTTSGASFTDTDSTGVTITVSRVVAGSNSAWIDAAGNDL